METVRDDVARDCNVQWPQCICRGGTVDVSGNAL
jgi:hypothetical protein